MGIIGILPVKSLLRSIPGNLNLISISNSQKSLVVAGISIMTETLAFRISLIS
jgi:hypothetical protein